MKTVGIYAIPYVEPTDEIHEYPTVSKTLAQKVDRAYYYGITIFNEFNSLNTKVNNNTNKIDAAERTINTAETNITNLQTQQETTNNQALENFGNLREAKQSITELKAQLKQLQNSLNSALENIESLKARHPNIPFEPYPNLDEKRFLTGEELRIFAPSGTNLPSAAQGAITYATLTNFYVDDNTVYQHLAGIRPIADEFDTFVVYMRQIDTRTKTVVKQFIQIQ